MDMGRGRPQGTDGYDFAYRMTVDDRYKRAAEGRVTLRKFVSAQAVLQILKATWTCLGALYGVPPNVEAVSSCAFGGIAVLLGTLGLKGSSKLLRFYIFFTIVSVGCALMPFASGNYVGKWRDNWEYLQVTGDYQRVLYYTLEGVQELAGILLQLVSVLIAVSFLKNVTPPKKRD
ncbi:hypothetical protein M758_1G245000 [Ceratodon purpureus]|nr:hypothetical protein M758_1G245000 [Ceratodon purpureus]